MSVRDFDGRIVSLSSKVTACLTLLVEVTAYYATGQVSGQQVKLLKLDGDTASEVWKYSTVGNDGGIWKGSKNHKTGVRLTGVNITRPYNLINTTVASILEDEVYLGHTINLQYATVSCKNKKRIGCPISEQLLFENTHKFRN